jgi:hypothetical protein
MVWDAAHGPQQTLKLGVCQIIIHPNPPIFSFLRWQGANVSLISIVSCKPEAFPLPRLDFAGD